MVDGSVCVWLGMFDIKVIVVLNLFIVLVKFSVVFVRIVGKISGSVMVRKIYGCGVFSVVVVFLSLGFMVLKFRWMVWMVSGKDMMVVVSVVFV